MPDSLTPGAGPFPSTPGIAPNPPSLQGGSLSDWLQGFVKGLFAPLAGLSAAAGAQAGGSDIPTATKSVKEAIQNPFQAPGEAAASVISGKGADWTKAIREGFPWQSIGVYLALFVLLAIGVTSLLHATKEK